MLLGISPELIEVVFKGTITMLGRQSRTCVSALVLGFVRDGHRPVVEGLTVCTTIVKKKHILRIHHD